MQGGCAPGCGLCEQESVHQGAVPHLLGGAAVLRQRQSKCLGFPSPSHFQIGSLTLVPPPHCWPLSAGGEELPCPAGVEPQVTVSLLNGHTGTSVPWAPVVWRGHPPCFSCPASATLPRSPGCSQRETVHRTSVTAPGKAPGARCFSSGSWGGQRSPPAGLPHALQWDDAHVWVCTFSPRAEHGAGGHCEAEE